MHKTAVPLIHGIVNLGVIQHQRGVVRSSVGIQFLLFITGITNIQMDDMSNGVGNRCSGTCVDHKAVIAPRASGVDGRTGHSQRTVNCPCRAEVVVDSVVVKFAVVTGNIQTDGRIFD